MKLARTMTVLALLAIAGCADKAQPDYDRCVTAERADVLAAAAACEAAVAADPNSPSGKEAASKLLVMKPYIAQAKAAKDPKLVAEKAKADEIAWQAATQARAATAARLKASAKIERTGEDDQCVSDGKPPRGLAITGGTYDQNEAVATAMGCVRTHVYYPQQGHSVIDNYYCCP
jgi:hypothetical protein